MFLFSFCSQWGWSEFFIIQQEQGAKRHLSCRHNNPTQLSKDRTSRFPNASLFKKNKQKNIRLPGCRFINIYLSPSQVQMFSFYRTHRGCFPARRFSLICMQTRTSAATMNQPSERDKSPLKKKRLFSFFMCFKLMRLLFAQLFHCYQVRFLA